VLDIEFHPEASDEFASSRAWYHARSARAAERFEAEVERVLSVIRATPEFYPEYDATTRFAVLRRYPYTVVYEVQQARIYVIAVAHTSREPGYWTDRSRTTGT
jgi:plasmid stabilization system protein ParE